MSRLVFAAILTSCFLPQAAVARDNADPSAPPIPTTISKEAQEFLRSPTPALELPSTAEQWEALQVQIEEESKDQSKRVIAQHAQSVAIENMGGVDIYIITPKQFNPATEHKALFYIHGGGFCLYSPKSSYRLSARLANRTGLRVYCVDYRLAPQDPFPAGLEDCLAAYRHIIKRVRPENLGVFGGSAGGSLCLTMLLKAQAAGLPMPGALACISPWTDLTLSGESYRTNDGLDPVLTTAMARAFAGAYAGDANLHQPSLSPISGDYSTGFPPTIIQTGTRDLLLSDCVQLHQKMKEGGVDVELSVREGMWHGYHVIPNCDFPEAKAGYQELADFFRRKLRLGNRNPQGRRRKLLLWSNESWRDVSAESPKPKPGGRFVSGTTATTAKSSSLLN